MANISLRWSLLEGQTLQARIAGRPLPLENDFPRSGQEHPGIKVLILPPRRFRSCPVRRVLDAVRHLERAEEIRPALGILHLVQRQQICVHGCCRRRAWVYRLAITDSKWERLGKFDGLNFPGSDELEGFLSLTADDQPAIMSDTSVVQIYSAKWTNGPELH